MTRAVLGLGALLVVAAYLAQVVALGSWQVDDAGISFAYARNLALGHGPVTNPGDLEPNEGWSNPVWTALIALAVGVGAFDLVLTPKILSVACTLGAFVLAGDLVRRLGDGRATVWSLLPAAALVANGGWVAWSVGGLENPQYVLVILLALVLYVRDAGALHRRPRSGPAFFLVAVSRPEGLAYAFAAGADALVRAARTRAWGWLGGLVLGLLALLLPYALVHLAVFDDLLPNTYYAKARDLGLAERVLDPRAGGWRYLTEGLSTWPQVGLLLLLPLALVDRAVWRRGGGAVLAALAASVAFVLQSGGDWMMEHRFMSPTFALIAVLAAVGGRTLAELVWPTRAGQTAAALAGVGAVAAVGSALPEGLARIHGNPTVPLEDRLTRLPKLLAVADALGIERPRMLMSDMGGPMWVNADGRSRIVDMFGLCDKHVAHALHDRDVARLWSYGFETFQPQFVQVPPTLVEAWRLGAYPHFLDAFAPLDDASVPFDQARWFYRRELLEPAWEDAFADGDVVVQGPVRVHRARVVDAHPGQAEIELVVSLRRAGLGRPSARLSLVGERPGDATVTLLDLLDPRALVADRVYRQRLVLPVPADVGVVHGVAAVGAPEPSDLPRPAGWRTEPIPPLVFDPTRPASCSPPQPASRLRVRLTTRVPEAGEAVTLDVRGFDDQGRFVGRRELWRWRRAHAEPQALHLEVEVPPGSATVRLCGAGLEGGRIDVDAWAWEVPIDPT